MVMPGMRLLTLAFGLLGCSTALGAIVNITVTDQSRILTYGPSTTGIWNQSWTGIPWTAYDPSQVNYGVGTSYSSTNYSNAQVSFSFSGSAVYALGNQTDGNCIIAIDGDTSSSQRLNQSGVLASSHASSGYHTVSITWKGQTALNFTGVLLSVDVPGSQSSITTHEVLAANGNTSYNSVDYTFSTNDWAAADGGQNDPYYEAFTAHQWANVAFTPPSNASLMIMYGSVDATDGPFSLDVVPTNSATTLNTSLAGPANQSFALNYTFDTTLWSSQNQIIAIRRLDPHIGAYQATLTSLAPRGLGFGFHSVVYYSSSQSNGTTGRDSSNRHSSNTAAIAAGVAVPVAVLAILALIAFCYRRRLAAFFGRRNQPPKEQIDVLSSDDVLTRESVHPYTIPLSSPATAYSRQSDIDILSGSGGGTRKGYLAGSFNDESTTHHTLLGTYTSEGSGDSPARERTTDSSGSAPSSNRLPPGAAAARLPLRLHEESGSSRAGDSVRGTELGGEETSGEGSSGRGRDKKAALAGPGAARGGATRRPQQRRPVHDTDAGRITDPGVELLPPTYNPDWGRPEELAEDVELSPSSARRSEPSRGT